MSRLPFYTNEANRETIMQRAFDITRLETRSRRFACEVKTNDFGASVLLTRPLTEAEAAERTVNKTSPRKKRRKTSKQPQENDEMYAEEYRRLPDGYQPESREAECCDCRDCWEGETQATEAGQVTEAVEAATKAEKAAVFAWRTDCAD